MILGTMYSICDSDELLKFYIDEEGNLCVWNGIEGEKHLDFD